uniref:Uncharacterized protein n=1 Tax=viral metagenome TaxID=1070528 RepID=A0A6M3JI49_9ZZZZ
METQATYKKSSKAHSSDRRLDAVVSPIVYEINNFNDLLKIPIGRLPKALDEIKTGIIQAKIMYDVATMCGNTNDDVIRLPLKWTDDDKGNITLECETTIQKG